MYAITWNPSLCSRDRIEAVSEISIESKEGRGLRGTEACCGETISLGEGALSGDTAPEGLRDEEDAVVVELELALLLAPKNDANGLMRPNFAVEALSLVVSFSLVDVSSSGALLSGGKGKMAVSADRSYEGKNVEDAEVDVGRRAEMAFWRRAVSRIASMILESGGKIDSKQILLPRIVPSIPDKVTNMLGDSSSVGRLASLLLLGRLLSASGDITKTI